MKQFRTVGWSLTLAALMGPGSAAMAQDNAPQALPGASTYQGTAGLAAGSYQSGGAGHWMGMHGPGGAQVAATDRYVYVLRGGQLTAFETRSLRLTGTAMLPGPWGGQAVAGSRMSMALPGDARPGAGRAGAGAASGNTGTRAGQSAPSDRTGGAGAGAAGADRTFDATGRTPGAAGTQDSTGTGRAGDSGTAAGATGAAGGRSGRGAGVGAGAGLSGQTDTFGGLSHAEGDMAAGPTTMMGHEAIRLVATDRAVYLLMGDQLLAFEAGTLRQTGSASVPSGGTAGGQPGRFGTGTGGQGSGIGSDRFTAPGGAGSPSGAPSGTPR